MKEWITDIIIGVLCIALGFLVGFTVNKKEPPTKEILLEIKNLQQDLVRVEIRSTENLINIQHLLKWQDSIIFRPPERKKKLGKNRKQPDD